ncbi:polysaccharide biosynthesis/export family protein [Croceicoccus sp. BE223]|uniref:polysaccharide biosynthesis/export family protein n=1 Tax=Croceicoccus sp. BE223 TaxID=2817716 RepID=UPI002866E5E0|nr:polysaccharide biosynthesis/export family protein [Croceicoccus sp. BE223]MDR7102064.1 polysaccharide export outer membrane protein [Croceicoccus sp. BE223]
MKFNRVAAVAGAMLVLSGCQKTVESRLPVGTDAYAAIEVPPAIFDPAEYVMRPGDRLNVNVFREADFSVAKALVDASGNVTLPMLGTVRAAGKTQAQFASEVKDMLAARYLRDPRVSIMVDTPALATVSVEGEVEQPGVYEMMPGQTLLTALAQARSPTDLAKLDEVMIFRNVDGRRQGGRFDVAMIRAGEAADPRLLQGDVIVVGYSRVRSAFQDFLKTVPLLNVFAYY